MKDGERIKMKFLTVVMMVFFINISASLVNTIQIIEGYGIQPDQQWIDSTKTTISDKDYFQSSAVQETSTNFGFGDFVKGFALFVGTFAFGIVAVPYLMIQFGMDITIATIISVPIYILYGLGIAQFIANRGTKSMD